MKKQTKGLVSLWLALAMVVTLVTPALATPGNSTIRYTEGTPLQEWDDVGSGGYITVNNFNPAVSLKSQAKLNGWQEVALKSWKLWTGDYEGGVCMGIRPLEEVGSDATMTQEKYTNMNADYLLLEPVYDPASYLPVYIWTRDGGVGEYLDTYPSGVLYDMPLKDQTWLADDAKYLNTEKTPLEGWKLWMASSGSVVALEGDYGLTGTVSQEGVETKKGNIQSSGELIIDDFILQPLFRPRYEISHQPTQAEPFVKVQDNRIENIDITSPNNVGTDITTAENVTYQWYKATDYVLADKEVEGATIGAVATDGTFGTYDGNVWKSEPIQGQNIHGLDQLVSFQAGDVITVTGDGSIQQCVAVNPSSYSDMIQLTRYGNEYIGTVETEGIYELMVQGGVDQFTCSVKVNRIGSAVQGQNANRFDGPVGTYVCQATVDGVTITSEPMKILHSHSVGTDSTQVDFDQVLTTNESGALFINGESAEAHSDDNYYTLPAGKSYVLGDDLDLAKGIRFQGAEGHQDAARLCLNGHLITGATPDGCVLYGEYANLVVCDCNETANHDPIESAVDGANPVTVTGGGIVGAKKTDIINSDSTVSWQHGDLKFYGGSIVGNQSNLYTICLNSGKLTLDEVTVTDNESAGATVYLSNGSTATLNSGVIRGNRSTGANGMQPGAIYVLGGSTLTLSGNPRIEGNTLNGKEYTLTVGYDDYYAEQGKYSVSLNDLADSVKIPVRVWGNGYGLFTDATAKDRASAFTVEDTGYFIEAKENGLAATELKITQEPTKENSCTVIANGPAPTYRWYKTQRKTDDVTDQNAASARSQGGSSVYAAASKSWTGVVGNTQNTMTDYFTIDLKKGDAVTVTLGEAIGAAAYLSLKGFGSERKELAADATGCTLTAPADGEYTVALEGPAPANAPALTATWTHDVLTGEAVCKDAALATAKNGAYACQVTWSVDGKTTTATSAPVDYTHTHTPAAATCVAAQTCTVCGAELAPATGHNWATAWVNTDPAHHWHACQNANCPVTENADKDGYGDHVYDNDRDATCNTCGYARTLAPSGQPDPDCDIFGAATENGIPVSGIKVTLKKGNTIVGETTTDNGAYHFDDVDPGSYNIVATKGGKTMTILVTVTAGAVTEKNLTMPSENVNSVLVVEEGAPDVVVGGLEVEAVANKAENSTVTVTMTVEGKTEKTADHARNIKTAAQGRSLEYLDIKVEKTVDAADAQPIPTTGGLLSVIIPFETDGKYNEAVYRYHSRGVDTLTTEKNRAGEYIVLNDTDIVLYVKNFSTYAVGYTETEELPEPPAPSHTSSSSSTVQTPDKADETCSKDAACPAAPFTDLDLNAWYHDGVHYCLEKGLMQGTSDTTFAPDMDTSRAMIATILWRLQGSKVVSGSIPYPDVAEGMWYTEAVRWAAKEGIVKGYGNGNFGPDDPITREQLATMLYRCEQKYGGGGFAGSWMFRLDFTDIDQISEWAYEALCWMTMNDVITGKDGKALDPKGQATRAEAATMLQRYIQTADK